MSPMSPTAPPPARLSDSPPIDSLVTLTAQRVAAAFDDLARALDKRDNYHLRAHGAIELVLHAQHQSHTYHLSLDTNTASQHAPTAPHTTLTKASQSIPLNNSSTPAPPPPTTLPLPLEQDNDDEDDDDDDDDDSLDTVLQKGLLGGAPSQKRKLDDQGTDAINKRVRVANNNGHSDAAPLVTKTDLEHLLSKLSGNATQDNTESITHVQHLISRFSPGQSVQPPSKSAHEQQLGRQNRPPFRDSVLDNNGPTPASFPSSNNERDEANMSMPELIRRESKLLSAQIRWVEECRRVAADLHNTREETWRTSSAGFHDRNRHDRETFQGRMLHESGQQSQYLTQILNEVKAIGLYTQSMKWETPSSLTAHLHYSPPPAPPASYPTQPAQSPATAAAPPPQPPPPISAAAAVAAAKRGSVSNKQPNTQSPGGVDPKGGVFHRFSARPPKPQS